MSLAQKFDDSLFHIAQELGTAEGFLQSVFGFLSRRSNFYDREDLVETLLLQVFRRNNQVCPPSTRTDLQQAFIKFPEVLLRTSGTSSPLNLFTNEDIQTEKETRSPEVPPDPEFSTLNGGETDHYRWSQSDLDLSLQVQVPIGTKAKDILVKVERHRVELTLRKDGKQGLLRGELTHSIDPEHSFWLLEGQFVVFNLHKEGTGLWNSALKGDPERTPVNAAS